AVVVLAAFLNALRIVDKRPEDVRVVLTGVGAAGIATTDMLLAAGVHVIVGLSGPGAVTRDGIASMADGAIVFAMANPTPEVAPEEIEGLAAVVATGRSDYPNQINNVLAFPGVF